jgi:hypothetical protein
MGNQYTFCGNRHKSETTRLQEWGDETANGKL